jgi:hypothetical protein
MVICKMRRKTLNSLGVIALMTLVAGAQAQVTLSAKTSFSGDGWLNASEDATVQDLGGTTRGMAYDSATGNLVVNFRGTSNLSVINGTSGVKLGNLSTAGLFVGGGGATNSMVAAANGRIYVANLITSNTDSFKIYEFATATVGQTGTTFFSGTSSLPRVGDSFDAISTGANSVEFIASGTGSTGYANIAGGVMSVVAPAGVPAGGLRLGLTYGSSNSVVFGTNGMNAALYYINAGVNTTLTGNGTGSARPLDFAVVNGVPLLATIDTVTSQVQVFDMTNPLAPVFVAQGNNTPGVATAGTFAANGNGTGSIKFAQDQSGAWNLYAMSSNQGIQAFNVEVVPEPATMIVLAGAAAIAARRRRKNS